MLFYCIMKYIEIYNKSIINSLTRARSGETKLGEEIQTINADNWQQELKQLTCRFVLIGIPEDIGVRANFGRGGAHTAWRPALESFLNQQSNLYLSGGDTCVLGHVTVDDLMQQSLSLNPKDENDLRHLRKLVSQLDERVCKIIAAIVGAGKIPVVIGGGHNNAYPVIKGCSMALNKKINVINCDPHTDFRALEGRHSGNGFSYAYRENHLGKYSVFCVHEQYNNQDVIMQFKSGTADLWLSTYEDVFVREQTSFSDTLNQNISFVNKESCGVEIDLDAITNVPSSAKTSSGISPVQARQYAYQCGKQLQALYFHIAEGAPVLSHIKADNKTGKLIAYLVSDFMKGVQEKSMPSEK